MSMFETFWINEKDDIYFFSVSQLCSYRIHKEITKLQSVKTFCSISFLSHIEVKEILLKYFVTSESCLLQFPVRSHSGSEQAGRTSKHAA